MHQKLFNHTCLIGQKANKICVSWKCKSEHKNICQTHRCQCHTDHYNCTQVTIKSLGDMLYKKNISGSWEPYKIICQWIDHTIDVLQSYKIFYLNRMQTQKASGLQNHEKQLFRLFRNRQATDEKCFSSRSAESLKLRPTYTHEIIRKDIEKQILQYSIWFRDIIQKIEQYSLAETSKCFQFVGFREENETLKRIQSFGIWQLQKKEKNIQQQGEIIKNICKITINSNKNTIPDRLLKKIAIQCTNLSQIEINNIYEPTFLQKLSIIKPLRRLILNKINVFCINFPHHLPKLPNLQQLIINFSKSYIDRSLSFDDLRLISQCFKNLRKIKGQYLYSQLHFNQPIIQLDHLQNLQLSTSQNNIERLPFNITNLKSLSLCSPAPKMIIQIASLEKLEQFKIQNLLSLQNLNILTQSLTQLKQLRIIRSYNSNHCSFSHLIENICGLCHLQVLQLQRCFLTNDDVTKLYKAHSNLWQINLNSNTSLTYQSIGPLIRSNRKLKILKLNSISLPTQIIIQVAKTLPSIQNLQLSMVQRWSPFQTVYYLYISRMKNLKQICLAYSKPSLDCCKINPKALLRVFRNKKQIEIKNIFGYQFQWSYQSQKFIRNVWMLDRRWELPIQKVKRYHNFQ